MAPNDGGVANRRLVADGGFSDIDTKNAGEPHLYTFTFAPGVSVTNFSLHMLDYGDLNMPLNLPPEISHYVSMTAYDANGNPIPDAKQELSYTTPTDGMPRSSSLYGDLRVNGDAAAHPRAARELDLACVWQRDCQGGPGVRRWLRSEHRIQPPLLHD